MKQPQILLIDDAPNLRQMVQKYLKAEGFKVSEAANGQTALSLLRDSAPDLVLLDVGLPDIDGFTVLQEIRKMMDVPVIMLTARSEEIDRVLGLTIGADDYITKPFSPRELVARIKAVLRRGATGRTQEDELKFQDLLLNLPRRQVQVGSTEANLSALEFDLLAALASAPGRVFTRQQLLERVWGFDYFGAERVVDVHIRNLRKELGDNANEPRFIGTVRGVGYRLIAEPL